MIWHLSHRADPLAREIADRHYNRQKPGTPQFVPPGRCLVLRCTGAFLVTSWPFAEYVKHAWPGAWVCSAFRRESGDVIASRMVEDAVAATRWRWPEAPEVPCTCGAQVAMVTFVDASKTRHKRDPGRCFLPLLAALRLARAALEPLLDGRFSLRYIGPAVELTMPPVTAVTLMQAQVALAAIDALEIGEAG